MKKNEYRMEDLIPIVAELSDKYTSKESTSITFQKARQLMNAVIYCIREYEECSSKADCTIVSHWSEGNTVKIKYREGYELVLQKTRKAKALYEEIIEEFKPYGNMAYYDTVIKGMPGFFLHYSPKFHPQDHLLTLDYPTIRSVYQLCGIDAVFQYLSYIKLEQIFLKMFSEEYVLEILSCYHKDNEELFINICSIVLRNVIGHVIAGKKITDRGFQISDMERIEKFITDNSEGALTKRLTDVTGLLVTKIYDGDEALLEYLSEDMKDFSRELQHAANYHCFNTIFLC